MNEEKIAREREEERAKWGSVVKVRFLNHFHDGNLHAAFEAEQQNPHVEKGEVRVLSRELLNRVISSGAEIEKVFE